MTRLSIDLPDEVGAKLADWASQSGHTSVEEFVAALLRAGVEEQEGEDWGAPEAVTFHSEEQLRSILLERVNDPRPGFEPTPEFWEEMRKRASGAGQVGDPDGGR